MISRQVLIVEDDDLIRDFLIDSLEMKGFRIQHAPNGNAALEKISQSAPQPVDVVLCDVQMPEVGGVELCRRLAEHHPGLPVVLMTGVHASEREQILEDSGAVDCLSKPFRIEQLVCALEGALSA